MPQIVPYDTGVAGILKGFNDIDSFIYAVFTLFVKKYIYLKGHSFMLHQYEYCISI